MTRRIMTCINNDKRPDLGTNRPTLKYKWCEGGLLPVHTQT